MRPDLHSPKAHPKLANCSSPTEIESSVTMWLFFCFATAILSQVSVKESLGEPVAPLIEPMPLNQATRLRFAMITAKKKTVSKTKADDLKGNLATSFVSGIRFNAPDDPWNKKHGHFLLKDASFDFAGIESGFMLLSIQGHITSNSKSKSAIPILFQFSGDKGITAAKGRLSQKPTDNGTLFFEVYAQRSNDAVGTMLVFVNPDRTWVMYKDATSGGAKDQLYTVKTDEQSLKKIEEERLAKAKSTRTPTPGEQRP